MIIADEGLARSLEVENRQRACLRIRASVLSCTLTSDGRPIFKPAQLKRNVAEAGNTAKVPAGGIKNSAKNAKAANLKAKQAVLAPVKGKNTRPPKKIRADEPESDGSDIDNPDDYGYVTGSLLF